MENTDEQLLTEEIPEEVIPQVEGEVMPEEEVTEEVTEEDEEVVPPEVEDELTTLLSDCEKEDDEVRLESIRLCRLIEEYSRGIYDIYWDEAARDYRQLDEEDLEDVGGRKNINITRPHMESIIAALSVKLPTANFFPDDAEDPNDIQTADAFNYIAKLIQKHNKSPLLLIRCLGLMWHSGTVFGYNYYRTDPKFGTVSIPETEQRQIFTYDVYCPNCGNLMGHVKETKPTSPILCSVCDSNLVPELIEKTESIEKIVGYSESPKGRVAIDFFGVKNVKVPFYARKQEDCGYLLFKIDAHYGMLKSLFPKLADNIREGSDGLADDFYERSIRLSSQYGSTLPKNLNTLKAMWLRPWMYWVFKEEECRDYCYKNFPNGCVCLFIDDKLVSVEDSDMDRHWTISFDPLTEFIHGEPMGKQLISVQEAENDLFDLSMQTIEYGISENFVDTKLIDFQKYKTEAAKPGMLTGVKAQPGKSISDGFFQTKPATLGQEVDIFHNRLEKMGQFAVGDFPALFGGEQEGGKTAYEYEKSGSRALQRLSLTYKKVVDLWIGTISKSTVLYAEQMKADEKNVTKVNGKYINEWIRKDNLTGKIGQVEPENSETLPQSMEQVWQMIVRMLEMKDPVISTVILAPENAQLLKMASGMHDLYIPGENDRNKQFAEIYEIIESSQPVPIDLEIDDHPVHMRVLKQFLTSPQGMSLYRTTPETYQLLIQHYLEHQNAQIINTMEPVGNSQAGQPPISNVGE